MSKPGRRKPGVRSNAAMRDAHQADAAVTVPTPLGPVQSGSPSAAPTGDGTAAVSLPRDRAYLEEFRKDIGREIRSLRYCEKQCKLLGKGDAISLALPRSLPSEIWDASLAVLRRPDFREHMTPDELRAFDAVGRNRVDFGCKSVEDVPAALLRVKDYAVRFGTAANALRKLEVRILAALGEVDSQAKQVLKDTEESKRDRDAGLDNSEIDLDGTSEGIIDAMGKEGMKEPHLRKEGKAIARLAKSKFNSHFKTTLSHLRQRGILTNPGRGYYLSESGWRFYEQRKVRTKSGLG